MKAMIASKRIETIKKLKEMAENKSEAKRLTEAISEECGILIQEPENASSYQVSRYNNLIMGSELTFIERKELLMQ